MKEMQRARNQPACRGDDGKQPKFKKDWAQNSASCNAQRPSCKSSYNTVEGKDSRIPPGVEVTRVTILDKDCKNCRIITGMPNSSLCKLRRLINGKMQYGMVRWQHQNIASNDEGHQSLCPQEISIAEVIPQFHLTLIRRRCLRMTQPHVNLQPNQLRAHNLL